MQNSVVKLCLLYGTNCVFAPAACGLLLNMQRLSLTIQYLLQPDASEFPGKKGSGTHMLASQNYKAMRSIVVYTHFKKTNSHRNSFKFFY